MRVAYADPPYPGMAAKHYRDHPDYEGEVDHTALIGRLMTEFDAWVLHTSSTALRQVLPLCPHETRVGAWTKSFASFKPGVNPAYTWEPVLFYGSRRRSRADATVRDYVTVPITLRRGLVGAKPESVCFWVFEFLGLQSADELVDLFPGTGAVTRAWEKWRRQMFGSELYAEVGQADMPEWADAI